MAQMTSAMAAKYLKKLNEEHEALLRREKKTMTFTAAIQEDKEEVRPEYDYGAAQEQLLELERKIRAIKHGPGNPAPAQGCGRDAPAVANRLFVR